MRAPTSDRSAYSWWVSALGWYRENGSLRDFPGPINENEPQAGYYKRRLVKGGPWVGGHVWVHRVVDAETCELMEPEELRAEVDGKPADPADVWSYLCAHPITHAEYQFLTANAAWARANDPSDAAANPEKPIDHLRTPIAF